MIKDFIPEKELKKRKDISEKFNVIAADTEWQTFEALSPIQEEYNILNLSSEFAVSFILDYEKIDVLVLGKKIACSESIMQKADRKRIKVFVIGNDLKYPVDTDEVRKILELERTAKISAVSDKNQSGRLNRFIKNVFSAKSAIIESFGEEAEQQEGRQALKPKKKPERRSAGSDMGSNAGSNADRDSRRGAGRAARRGAGRSAGRAARDEAVLSGGVDGKAGEDDWFKILSGEKTFNPPGENDETDYLGCGKKENDAEKSENYTDENDAEAEENAAMDAEKATGAVMAGREDFESFWDNKPAEREVLYEEATNEEKGAPFLNKSFIAIKQKIVVFIKAKGGVGSTILSVLLTYQLRKLKTLLIDMNFSEGGSDLGYYLDMPKSPNMMVFTEGYNRNAMDNSIINFKGYFDILQAPPSYEMTKKLDLQDIYSLIDVARKKYHLIIFDMPNQINDIFFGVLDMADIAVLVSDFTTGSFGRLASITNRFIYNDVEKILVLNRKRNGNAIAYAKSSLKDFCGLKEFVSINECEALSERTSFTGFDLSGLKEVNLLTEKVMEKLSCE